MATRRINKNTKVDVYLDDGPASHITPVSPDPHTGAKKGAQSSVPKKQTGRDSQILSHKSQGGRRPAKKLGVKKLSTDMPSFEEFEKSAIEEAQQTTKPLGNKNTIDTDWLPFSTGNLVTKTDNFYTWNTESDRPSRSSSTVVGGAASAPRLGFGQTGFTPSQLSSESGRSSTDSSISTRFEHQRCISSDEYFGRNALDPDQERQLVRRLDDFDNAAAISSDDYFGRPEEATSHDKYDYVERAKDIALRLATNADDEIENVKAYIGRGASKITAAIWNATK
ncbi:hypothetical protein V1520DRAFT_123606 [Lipomyces starkeyi]|uniref:Uncharacterized protein n=1 Tax=Lipomyces starkeyi NRRL Y-11557 TaxID=675824 RepID=A0A1E3QAE4_LIPST|nr:hypothetical protein LIPSTDRAFT_103892 [Lipomyces starkeyi NRRL Y-11557]